MSQSNPSPASPAPVIGIVGLEALGLALGQALRRVRARYEVLGHDREPTRARAAQAAGAIDRGLWSVAELAAAADLLFLAEPGAASLDTLAVVAPHLRPGALVTTTGPALGPACRRAAELLPPGVSFVAGHPIPRESDTPFQGATYCLAPLPTAGDEAVRVMHDLAAGIGAAPYFIDAAEHDGLAAGVSGTPYLMAIALLGVLDRSPSARDLRRLAGPTLRALVDNALTEGAGADPLSMSGAPEGLASWLDQVIAELAAVRDLVKARDGESLAALAAEAESTWADWQTSDEAAIAEDPVEPAGDGGALRTLFFGRRGRKR